MASVLQLVFLRAQAKHRLCMGVEFIVKVIQEGSPRPILKRGDGITKEDCGPTQFQWYGGVQGTGVASCIY